METVLQGIDLKNIDRSKWRSYRFDEIAKNVSERVDPNNTDLEVYVGLEHIDSESLHIKRTGTPDDVNGTKLKCYPGDIIFGRRRAYQRKAGIATFNGFCSAHSLILRANPAVIHPELFPFFIHSDLFMNRAIDISVGSLSPTINWGTLKAQEFQLPLKELQKQLAELLWSIDDMIEEQILVLNKLQVLYEKSLADFFDSSICFESRKLGDLVEIKSGESPSVMEYLNSDEGIPYYKVNDLNESFKFQYFSKEWVKVIASKLIPIGSVIFPKRGAAIMTNKVRIVTQQCHVDTNIMSLTVRDESVLNNEFLYYFLYFRKLFKIADTSQIPQINNVHINPYPINLPPIEIQQELKNKLNQIVETIKAIELKIKCSKALKKSLINQIFG